MGSATAQTLEQILESGVLDALIGYQKPAAAGSASGFLEWLSSSDGRPLLHTFLPIRAIVSSPTVSNRSYFFFGWLDRIPFSLQLVSSFVLYQRRLASRGLNNAYGLIGSDGMKVGFFFFFFSCSFHGTIAASEHFRAYETYHSSGVQQSYHGGNQKVWGHITRRQAGIEELVSIWSYCFHFFFSSVFVFWIGYPYFLYRGDTPSRLLWLPQWQARLEGYEARGFGPVFGLCWTGNRIR